MKKCPFCSEAIQDSAIKCRYCGEFLDNFNHRAHPNRTDDTSPTQLPPQKSKSDPLGIRSKKENIALSPRGFSKSWEEMACLNCGHRFSAHNPVDFHLMLHLMLKVRPNIVRPVPGSSCFGCNCDAFVISFQELAKVKKRNSQADRLTQAFFRTIVSLVVGTWLGSKIFGVFENRSDR